MNQKREIPYKIYLEESEMQDSGITSGRIEEQARAAAESGHASAMTAEELSAVFCEDLVDAGRLNNDDRFIDIPQEIQDFYKMYRPSPLVRAYCLEKQLDTPAKIYISSKETIPAAA